MTTIRPFTCDDMFKFNNVWVSITSFFWQRIFVRLLWMCNWLYWGQPVACDTWTI